MKNKEVLTMDKALVEVFAKTNEELVEFTKMNYNTIASWRYNYRRNGMSYEKKIEILTKLGYQFKEESIWKKLAS